MAQRRRGEREPIVETFLKSNEEICDMGDTKRRRYSQLMAGFKRDTLTWTLSQRRRFCGHANSLLRSLKKPERLELHHSGNKLMFRVGLVDVQRRNNEAARARGRRRENEHFQNENEDGDNSNQENEIFGREGHKRVYRRTARQKKRGRRPVAETSELRVEINNKDRAIRKMNSEIRSEKRDVYLWEPGFFNFAKLIVAMKIVLTELPLHDKPIKLMKLIEEAENGATNLLDRSAQTPFCDELTLINQIIDIVGEYMDRVVLAHKDGDIYIHCRNTAEASVFEPLQKLRKDLEQFCTDKEALGNRLKEVMQN